MASKSDIVAGSERKVKLWKIGISYPFQSTADNRETRKPKVSNT